MDHLGRSVVFLVGLALSATGCSAGKDAGSSESDSGSRASRAATAWERVLDRIGPDGEVELSTALQAFSVRYAPLPGVDVPKGAPEKGLHSGTMALRWIAHHWDRLTPDQRRAARPFVDPESRSTGPRRTLAGLPARDPAPSPTAGPATADPRVTMLPKDKKAAEAMIAWFSDPKRLDRPGGLGLPFAVVRTTERPRDPRTAADTQCLDTYGLLRSPLPPTHGLIRIYQSPGVEDPQQFEFILAHEVFHLFQCSMHPNTKVFTDSRAWLLEGSASWAAQAYSGYVETSEWSRYLKSPDEPRKKLFAMSYEALGFFAQLDQSGVDWWKRLRPMLAAGTDNEKAFLAAGPTERFLDSWAAGLFREPDLGQDWEIAQAPQGFGRIQHASPGSVTVASDASERFETEAYTNRIAYVRSTADLVHLTATGRVRIADGPDHDHRGVTDGYFCTKSGGCTCPKGTAGAAAVEQMPRLKQDARLAVTGGVDGVRVSLTGVPLSKLCREKKKKKKSGRLACAIPVPGGSPRVAPGRYEGTITYTDTRVQTDGIGIKGSGKGPAAFTVDENGRIVDGTYSLPHKVALSRDGAGYGLEVRIDRAPITGTTAKPVLTWKPRVVKAHIAEGEEWVLRMRPIFEASGPIRLSALKPTKNCDAVSMIYRYVPGEGWTGAQQLVVRARVKQ